MKGLTVSIDRPGVLLAAYSSAVDNCKGAVKAALNSRTERLLGRYRTLEARAVRAASKAARGIAGRLKKKAVVSALKRRLAKALRELSHWVELTLNRFSK